MAMTRLRGLVILSLLTLVSLLLAGRPGVAQAAVHPQDVTVLYYDDSQAGPYQGNVEQAVANWNQSVHNVRMEPGGSDITIYTDADWPHANPTGLGTGSVDIGQQAIDQGYDVTRIAAHELGHILGLDDNYNGDCNALMSGHSAGTSCTNAFPDADEIAQVDQNFAGSAPRAVRHHEYLELTTRF